MRTGLVQDIDAMQALSSRIAAEAHCLPEPKRTEAFLELLAALVAATSGTIATATFGNDTATALALDVTVLRLTEATADASRLIRELPMPGAAQ